MSWRELNGSRLPIFYDVPRRESIVSYGLLSVSPGEIAERSRLHRQPVTAIRIWRHSNVPARRTFIARFPSSLPHRRARSVRTASRAERRHQVGVQRHFVASSHPFTGVQKRTRISSVLEISSHVPGWRTSNTVDTVFEEHCQRELFLVSRIPFGLDVRQNHFFDIKNVVACADARGVLSPLPSIITTGLTLVLDGLWIVVTVLGDEQQCVGDTDSRDIAL